jgi:hypothetical protein
LHCVPRYFFDLRDGDRVIVGDEALEFKDLEAARGDAAASLAEMAHDLLPCSAHRNMVLDVRSESGKCVLRLVLAFTVECLTESHSFAGQPPDPKA